MDDVKNPLPPRLDPRAPKARSDSTPREEVSPPVARPTQRPSVRLGRRFAGTIATRLDAHPGTQDSARLEEEKKILDLARDVLSHRDPDPSTVNFLTQAVEMHTGVYGFSKAIYDELFKLHQARARNRDPNVPAAPRPAPNMPAASPYIVGTEAPRGAPSGRPTASTPTTTRPQLASARHRMLKG